MQSVSREKRLPGNGTSINVIFLSTLDATGISREKIVRQPKVSSFRGRKTFTVGFTNHDLTPWDWSEQRTSSMWLFQRQVTICYLESHGSTATKPFHRHTISAWRLYWKEREFTSTQQNLHFRETEPISLRGLFWWIGWRQRGNSYQSSRCAVAHMGRTRGGRTSSQ